MCRKPVGYLPSVRAHSLFSSHTLLLPLKCRRKRRPPKEVSLFLKPIPAGNVTETATCTPATKPRVAWSPDDDATMVQVLKEQRDAGNQADNNWKACVWTAVAAEVNKSITSGPLKTATGCKDHWTTVREPHLSSSPPDFTFRL